MELFACFRVYKHGGQTCNSKLEVRVASLPAILSHIARSGVFLRKRFQRLWLEYELATPISHSILITITLTAYFIPLPEYLNCFYSWVVKAINRLHSHDIIHCLYSSIILSDMPQNQLKYYCYCIHYALSVLNSPNRFFFTIYHEDSICLLFFFDSK